jgi:L-ascorbate metabolism protein UlaG (beta-lactamase superfamily)
VRENGQPVLATDPWLFGTCYFGSWALDHPLSDEQLATMRRAEYYWISHGHPDHLHHDSLATLSRCKKVLLPDHYSPEIADSLRADGFDVTILKYRQWFRLSPGVRIMCIDNMNQDGVLLIEAGDSLLVNLNALGPLRIAGIALVMAGIFLISRS